MKFGLNDKTLTSIRNVINHYENIDLAIIYGSRAKGNYRNGSDIDITLKGIDLKLKDILSLENEIDELMLPYKFDISIYEHIDNKDFLDHIDRVGKVFFIRD